MASLKNKVVLVTGGSKGVGVVIAKHLIKEKCKIALCARSFNELQVASDELKKQDSSSIISVCDVAYMNDVKLMIAQVIKHFGQIDVLINDAGIMIVRPMESFEIKEYEKAMDVMYWGIVNTTKTILPHMKKLRSGQIVNITSIGGMVSIPHMLPYTASTFAAIGSSQGSAAELRNDNIFVTTKVTGLMRTGFYVNAFFQRNNKKISKFLQSYHAHQDLPLVRTKRPESPLKR